MEELPVWDASERPAPPTYDGLAPAQRAPGQHLRMIHDHYRHGLAAVGEVVDRVASGHAEVAEARAAISDLGLEAAYQQAGSFCGQICRAIEAHHSIEDALMYPALRAADADLAPVLDRLATEHEVIHEILVRLDATLVAYAADRVRVGDLAAEYGHLRALLESHFTYEEHAIGDALGAYRIGL